MSLLEQLKLYFSYDFVKFAFIAGVLISLCAGLLGVVLVLKRYSMIGDGLSHVAFGAMAVAAVLGFAPMTVALPVTVAVAVLLLLAGEKQLIKGDSFGGRKATHQGRFRHRHALGRLFGGGLPPPQPLPRIRHG